MTKKEYEIFKNSSRLGGMQPNIQSLKTEDQLSTPATQTIQSGNTVNKVMTVTSIQADETIQTSKIRKNTFEEYEEDYRPHIACFKFLDKGKFCKVTCYDYDPRILTLAVYDEEARSFLVLGYDDGRMAKIPIEQLLKFDDYREYARNTKSKLIFATIANDGDAVVSVSRETKGKGRSMVRIDSLSELEEGTLTSTGERFYKEGIGTITSFEIVPKDKIEGLDMLMNKDSRTLGMPLSTLSNELKRRLSILGIKT